ncbi:MAG: DegT/DnrJ/EryC1/StrS family aminotransferase [candidate division Zixibacteria bacterium]|nr:DegT/DnrJ/EryC1/StrS family aminotransferase [candidate division Zixibacteria bacterium]
MKVPFLDLRREYASIKGEIDKAINEVFDTTQFILGPDVKSLEEEIARYCETKYAIGVASGTDALLLSLKAFGVGSGDEVITSAFSFFSSAGVIANLGAKPVFVDIDPLTYNIDPQQIEKRINKKTKAIMPVHLFGQCADMDPIMKLSQKYNLRVVEDAAQAIGAKYKERRAGSMGDAGCFSFYPTKNLGAAGDGGMVITNKPDLAEKIKVLRVHGQKSKYSHSIVGYNSRLDTLQAAILKVKLKYLESWHEKRRGNAEYYNKAFKGIEIITPKAEIWNYHIYNQYTIAVKNRDKLKEHLISNQIGFDTYYPVPLHLQKCFEDLGYKEGDLTNSERKALKVISLPIYPGLKRDEQDFVIEKIKEFVINPV